MTLIAQWQLVWRVIQRAQKLRWPGQSLVPFLASFYPYDVHGSHPVSVPWACLQHGAPLPGTVEKQERHDRAAEFRRIRGEERLALALRERQQAKRQPRQRAGTNDYAVPFRRPNCSLAGASVPLAVRQALWPRHIAESVMASVDALDPYCVWDLDA